ncbi:ABC transporter permease [Niallia sp. 01092]|uniref:ABC transporter permease n=1 Tax=unclassified Niallia TaxID=2837522 RepID=UPI003FD4B1AB
MSNLSLLFTIIFVFIALFLSKSFRIGLEKDIVVASVRAAVQLLVIGYVLSFIFDTNSPIFIILILICMLTVASQNIVKKKQQGFQLFWRVFITLAIVEAITQGIILSIQIIPPTARYIIPVSGMIIGNSMVIASLFLNRLHAEVDSRREEIQLILALGGTSKQAIHHTLKSAIKTSMIPTLESQKTIGLVQLPGMMTGQIIGGASPIQAVKFQLLIIFAIMASATLTCFILSRLTYPTLFNSYQQLVKR